MLHIEYLKSVQIDACGWCISLVLGVGAVFSKVSGTDKEGSFIEFDIN